MPQIKTQCQQVLDWIKREPITQMQALAHLGVFRLASRINDLRNQGVAINSSMVEVVDRFGRSRRVAKYSMGGK